MRVTVFDNNPGKGFGQWFLKTSWLVGCWLQKLLGLVDEYHAAESWDDALRWLISRPMPLTSVQYWGHGSPGTVWLSGRIMPPTVLSVLKPRMEDASSTVWFRCCSVFRGEVGIRFAEAAYKALGCRVVGHTFIIGLWQSGGHSLSPSKPSPDWLATEGLNLKNPWWPEFLRPWLPNTVFCMTTKVPSRW